MIKKIKNNCRVAVIGARGYVGNALIKLLSAHPCTELVAVSSRSAAGTLVCEHVPECNNAELLYQDLQADDMSNLTADVVFLALPNNASQMYVDALRISNPNVLIIDLSFDHRIEKTPGKDQWIYALPEVNSKSIKRAKLISNPGCYATAAQLALHPVRDMISGTPTIFGVSGYSGAGSTPNEKNNPDNLRDNILPYALAGHLHESEISEHIGHRVNFMPHVANFFSGLSVTVSCDISKDTNNEQLLELFTEIYKADPLIKVQKDIPFPRDIAGHNGVIIGGFAVDSRYPKNIRIVSVLDNLLKGAAVQAIQNMNIALGHDSLSGIKM